MHTLSSRLVDFGRFMKGMNGITDMHIFVWRAARHVRVGCSIHTLHETIKINVQFLTFSNIFSSGTTVPSKSQFQVDPPWGWETKVIQMIMVT